VAIFGRNQGFFHPRRLAELLMPRKGWGRRVRYFRARVQRLPGSPHSVALGFGCGVAASFSPFFGFHVLLSILLAWGLRGSMVAAALGTAVGNPLTFPLIIPSAIELGKKVLGLRAATPAPEFPPEAISLVAVVGPPLKEALELMLPYLVGGVLLGVPAAVASYAVLRPTVAAYQMARARLAAKSRRKRRPRAEGAVGP